MAPNKFEKHIKKQLEEREIRPSANAWDRLSERLDVASPPSRKRNYIWYGVAASFIGVLIVSVVYFNSGRLVNTPDIQVVDTNDRTTDSKTISNGEIETNTIETLVENNESTRQETIDFKQIDQNQPAVVENQITAVEEIREAIKKEDKKVLIANDLKDEMITTKIMEIVAAVDSLEQNNTALTNAEVDSLLRNAQEEILLDNLFDQNGSVDAMALLTQVEDELDQSFRDQIFESLKEGFLKVRTAVADRNK